MTDNSTDEPVIVHTEGSTLVITINRPAQRNAVDAEVSRRMAEAFTRLDESPDLRVGILHGSGENFCAGMDIKAFARGERAYVPGRGFAGLVEAPPAKPLIAAVEGWALGGGFEIVLACDLVVAGRSARFGLPEVKRGLVARGGGALRLATRIPRALALEMLMTGEAINAARAADLGLINRVVADGEAVAVADELATAIGKCAPLAVAAGKRVVVESPQWRVADAFTRQSEILDPVFASRDAAEGALAFQEKREPVWQGR